ncbi:DUF4124 domain-containing protein [Agitococcus lubricus]|uniref:Uncharacterized protein DUF4124 n=1 Tax=Agitococcus lubricus TaxID=1077255 RepID=A0A2T5IWC5_9GAMM|nr:DUF4124 domain-containing protein [Agitococcus lubricus]PTQ88217.1 uncharacterized protein DUF4124 [Agitococcus lubricus]
MKKTLITISLFTSVMFNAHAGDQFFKWVDEKGVTHYSQSPPDDTTKLKTQTVNVSTRVPSDSANAITNLEKQRSAAKAKLDEDKKDSKEGVKKVGEKMAANDAPEQYKERCAKLKQDASALSDKGGRIRIQDEKGEVRTLSEEERTSKLDETNRSIKAFCEK